MLLRLRAFEDIVAKWGKGSAPDYSKVSHLKLPSYSISEAINSVRGVLDGVERTFMNDVRAVLP